MNQAPPRLGLRENTAVIFTGDNGTARLFPPTINGHRIIGMHLKYALEFRFGPRPIPLEIQFDKS